MSPRFIVPIIGATAILMLAPAGAQDPSAEQPISADELKALVGDIQPQSSAALFLPLSALENPEVAASISPVAVDAESGVAIDGYDPVGYFTRKEATLGSEEFTATHEGAIYHFASAENRDLFLKDPERFAPAYGGYCTHSLAHGNLTPGNPNHWTIHGDRLFLTRNAASTKEFRAESARIAETAQSNWEVSPLASSDNYNIRAHQ